MAHLAQGAPVEHKLGRAIGGQQGRHVHGHHAAAGGDDRGSLADQLADGKPAEQFGVGLHHGARPGDGG